MKHRTDSTLNAIDRFSHKLGPVNTLLNEIVDRFIPKATVQACGGTICGRRCLSPLRCGHYDSALQILHMSFGVCGGCIVSICGGC
jgi:hypothetical protein